MTKRQLIDLLKHRLAGGDCPQEIKGKYHPRIIEKHIEIVQNYLMKTVAYREAEKENDWGLLDSYTKTFVPVDVEWNDTRKEFYSKLPVAVVDLPRNRGIRFISDQENQAVQYLYRDNNSVDIFSNLDIDRVSTKPRWYREKDLIYFSRQLMPTTTAVLMKVIPTFSSLDDNDEAPVPSAYAKSIFDLVFQSMMGMPPEKMSNDNNSNIP
jgi:hypothetical protein